MRARTLNTTLSSCSLTCAAHGAPTKVAFGLVIIWSLVSAASASAQTDAMTSPPVWNVDGVASDILLPILPETVAPAEQEDTASPFVATIESPGSTSDAITLMPIVLAPEHDDEEPIMPTPIPLPDGVPSPELLLIPSPDDIRSATESEISITPATDRVPHLLSVAEIEQCSDIGLLTSYVTRTLYSMLEQFVPEEAQLRLQRAAATRLFALPGEGGREVIFAPFEHADSPISRLVAARALAESPEGVRMLLGMVENGGRSQIRNEPFTYSDDSRYTALNVFLERDIVVRIDVQDNRRFATVLAGVLASESRILREVALRVLLTPSIRAQFFYDDDARAVLTEALRRRGPNGQEPDRYLRGEAVRAFGYYGGSDVMTELLRVLASSTGSEALGAIDPIQRLAPSLLDSESEAWNALVVGLRGARDQTESRTLSIRARAALADLGQFTVMHLYGRGIDPLLRAHRAAEVLRLALDELPEYAAYAVRNELMKGGAAEFYLAADISNNVSDAETLFVAARTGFFWPFLSDELAAIDSQAYLDRLRLVTETAVIPFHELAAREGLEGDSTRYRGRTTNLIRNYIEVLSEKQFSSEYLESLRDELIVMLRCNLGSCEPPPPSSGPGWPAP